METALQPKVLMFPITSFPHILSTKPELQQCFLLDFEIPATRLDCLQPKRSDCSFLQPNVSARVRVEFNLEPAQTSLQNQMQRRSGRTEEDVGQADRFLYDKATTMRSNYQRF